VCPEPGGEESSGPSGGGAPFEWPSPSGLGKPSVAGAGAAPRHPGRARDIVRGPVGLARRRAPARRDRGRARERKRGACESGLGKGGGPEGSSAPALRPRTRTRLKVLLAVHAGEPDSVCSELGGRELVLCGQVRKLARVRGELVGVAVGRHVVGHDVHAGHLVLLLPLHAPVLEPDLNLALGQAERVRDLDAAPPGEVAIEVELLLELEGLVPGVRGPLALRLAVRVHRTCNAPMRDSRLAC
jgi:hypothetical protein